MDQKRLAESLHALAAGTHHRPQAARLRDVFDAVDAAITAGVRRAAILAVLHDQGFTMHLKTFDNALYRIRKRNRKIAATDAGTTCRNSADLPSSSPQPMLRSTPETRRPNTHHPDDLTKIMAAPVDLDALSKLSKRNQQR